MRLVRERHYGARGRSRFAKDLGIGPSTYAHYETDRAPPADLLLRAARLTGTRLEWLLTGEGDPHEPPAPVILDWSSQFARRFQQLLATRPDLAPLAEAFLNQLDLLVTAGPESSAAVLPARPSAVGLIPVIGSTSAGTARYWSELPDSVDGPIADQRLEHLLEVCSEPAQQVPALFDPTSGQGPVSLVQYSRPDDHGLLEFITAPQVKATHPDAVAWRIDGDSMAPRYHDGDLVITSRQQPAEPGYACVARQQGQLGVNCKMFQREGDSVLLIPINPRYAVQRIPVERIQWASRVIAAVRLSSRGSLPPATLPDPGRE